MCPWFALLEDKMSRCVLSDKAARDVGYQATDCEERHTVMTRLNLQWRAYFNSNCSLFTRVQYLEAMWCQKYTQQWSTVIAFGRISNYSRDCLVVTHPHMHAYKTLLTLVYITNLAETKCGLTFLLLEKKYDTIIDNIWE